MPGVPRGLQVVRGTSYHLRNRGHNREVLFRDEDDYRHFLRIVVALSWPIRAAALSLLSDAQSLPYAGGLRNSQGPIDLDGRPVAGLGAFLQSSVRLCGALVSGPFQKPRGGRGELFSQLRALH